MNDARDRLIQLIHHCTSCEQCRDVDIADHLIANGIIVPPCKAGNVVYEADGEHGVVTHNITKVHWVFDTLATDDAGNKWWDYYCDEDISEAHFTREEAEQALKKGAGE